MLAVERRRKIIELLLMHGNVIVTDLSKRFNVTEETVRRDLEKLEKEGQLIRTHGGAYLSEYVTKEYPVSLREQAFVEGKERIGSICAEMVLNGETIMLDSSTTSLYIARFLKKSKKKVTVITNALKVEIELSDQENIKLVSTGGTLRTRSLSYVGYAATNSLSSYYADKAFVSCTGVHQKKGIMDSNEFEAEIRKMMMLHSEQKILVADYTKFGKTAFSLIADLNQIDIVVTDKVLGNEWMAEFEQRGIQYLVSNKKEEEENEDKTPANISP
ncbi:MAG: DeoR/GlpR transcriptional regulator [Thermicanus sp.]|nr:DeoR/GlpR transcriptional regulator [Thermicanus sp.]